MIIDCLIKMVYYELVKVTIDILSQPDVIINEVMFPNSVDESIITNQSSLFISKFWSLLYYFLDIKRRLSTAFYPQTNS